MDFHGVFIQQNRPMLKEHEIIVSNTGRNLAFAKERSYKLKQETRNLLQERQKKQNQRILLWEVA